MPSNQTQFPALETPEPSLENTEDIKDFIEDDIPVRLQDDYLIVYLRSRVWDRDQRVLLTQLENPTGTEDEVKRKKRGLERINEELARIETLRSSFEKEDENKETMEWFLYAQSQWKRNAFNKRKDNEKALREREKELAAQNTESHAMNGDENRLSAEEIRVQWDRKVLSKVGKAESWGNMRDLPRPKTEEERAKEKKEKKKKEEEEEKKRQQALKKKQGIMLQIREAFGKRISNSDTKMAKAKKTRYHERRQITRPRPNDSYGLVVTKVTLHKPKSSDAKDSLSYTEYKMERFPLNKCLFEEGEQNPLTEKCEEQTLRYFHIPANNMHWIEEAIGRYYNEKTPGEYNYRRHESYLKKSSNLLCREFWTSLQHGGVYDPIHARHMKSHCSRITTTSKDSNDKSTDNFIIFMPYLHWETHKRRKKMFEETQKVQEKHNESRSHAGEDSKNELISLASEVLIRRARELTGLEDTDRIPNRKRKKEVKTTGDKIKPGLLGHYLLEIARLYDAMDTEADVRVLRDYLFQEPPLHSRRTLDQSYFWKLPTTDERDRDQVVYRDTKAGKLVTQTASVVMVDQLWMYILDDNTIITSFPKRWGRNKPDPSGVHKAIRSRLENLGVGEVQSVHDLALLIMNQCSTIFFDRTKIPDERPEIIDIFSSALSNVSGMRTVAYEVFWRHLKKLNSIDPRLISFEAAARRSYLNINPEGELLRETHDIIDELYMMIRIYSQQLHVVEEFSRLLKSTDRRDEDGSSEILVGVMVEMRDHLQTLVKNTADTAPRYLQIGSHDLDGSLSNRIPENGQARTTPSTLRHTTSNPEVPDSKSSSNRTLQFAGQVCDDVRSRKVDLEDLRESALAVAQQLKDLLDLKQQQASIIEAKLALKRADESVMQGRSIMLFTIVTIVFSPLSFMTSVFGMNAKEFTDSDGNNSVSLRHEFKLIFPISLGVIVVSMSLAFSPWIRSIIGFLTSTSFAIFIEYTGLRHFWIWCVRDRKPEQLYESQVNIVNYIYSRQERAERRRELDAASKIAMGSSTHDAGKVRSHPNGTSHYRPRSRPQTENIEEFRAIPGRHSQQDNNSASVKGAWELFGFARRMKRDEETAN